MNNDTIELETQQQLDNEYDYYQSEYNRKTLFTPEEKKNSIKHFVYYHNHLPDPNITLTYPPRATDSLLHTPNRQNRACYRKGFCCILYTVILISTFIIGNMLLKTNQDNCKNNIPSIYTKANITICNKDFITCTYGNYTCNLSYNGDAPCNLINNTVCIYISQNNRNCAKEYNSYRMDRCADSLFIFNIMVVMFGGCCLCVIATQKITKNEK